METVGLWIGNPHNELVYGINKSYTIMLMTIPLLYVNNGSLYRNDWTLDGNTGS